MFCTKILYKKLAIAKTYVYKDITSNINVKKNGEFFSFSPSFSRFMFIVQTGLHKPNIYKF